MKIALVDNVLLEQGVDGFTAGLQPHLGLMSLAAVVRGGGHDVVLIDPKLDLMRGDVKLGRHFYAEIADRIVAHEPDIVGMTSLGCNFACTLRIADEVRRRRHVPVLLGGPHASILDREILERYPQFDAIVRHEAEPMILDAMDAASGGKPFGDVSGVSYRSNSAIVRTEASTSVVDPDDLPFPAYDAYPIAELGLMSLNVEAGRGCPFHCAFCSTASFFGRRYRLKSAQRLVADLDRLHAEYGVRHFNLTHDLFTVNKAKVRAFCDAVADRGYTWSCSARMDCVDRPLLAHMREAGCVSIYYGVEAGSQQLQAAVKKNLDLRHYHPIVRASLDLGLVPTVSFITGYPNETAEDQAATVELISDSINAYPDRLKIQLHLLTPEPGTEFLEMYRGSLQYDGYVHDFNFPPIDGEDAALMRADPVVFVCQQFYAAGCERSENIALVEGYRRLYGLGHGVLRAMLSSFEGSLREMFVRMGQFDSIAAFIADYWGESHPLYDLCCYLVGRSSLRCDRSERITVPNASTGIRLARCIAPIGFVRDGAALASCADSGAELDHDLPRSWYMIVADADLRAYDMFALDAGTFDFVNALSAHTTAERLSERFGAGVTESHLWSLGLMGALVRVG